MLPNFQRLKGNSMSLTDTEASKMDEMEEKCLKHLVDDIITLFRGEGNSQCEALADSVRKARTLVTGVEQMAGAIKRATPFIYDDRS